MKVPLLLVNAVMVVSATGVAWYASRDTAEGLHALAQLRADIARLETVAQTAEARVVQFGETARALRDKLETLQSAKAANPASDPATVSAPERSTPLKQETTESVAAKVAAAHENTKRAKTELLDFAKQRLWFSTAYQALFTALRLSAEQQEKFVDIGMRRYERMNDLNALRGSDHILPDTDPAVKQFVQTTQDEETAAYRELLGPEGYQRFVDYNRTACSRDIISGLGAAAVLAGIPFTKEQLEQFVRIVSENYLQKPWEGHVHYYWNGTPIDWQKTDAQVRPLMSEAQWQLYLNQADGATRLQSRMKNIFDTLVNKAVAADKAMAGVEPKN